MTELPFDQFTIWPNYSWPIYHLTNLQLTNLPFDLTVDQFTVDQFTIWPIYSWPIYHLSNLPFDQFTVDQFTVDQLTIWPIYIDQFSGCWRSKLCTDNLGALWGRLPHLHLLFDCRCEWCILPDLYASCLPSHSWQLKVTIEGKWQTVAQCLHFNH